MTAIAYAEALREEIRKVIRDYYNHTFEFAIDKFRSGDISVLVANAENIQRELDDPYLDKILSLIDRVERKAEIVCLRETADGFESVLEPEFEKGGMAAINALRRMALHKERELAKLDSDGEEREVA